MARTSGTRFFLSAAKSSRIEAGDADQRGIVGIGWQALGIWRKRVDQLAECGIDRLLVRHPAQRRALTSARGGAALRHVGRLVPAQHRADRAEVTDFQEAALEFFEAGLGRWPGILAGRPLGR